MPPSPFDQNRQIGKKNRGVDPDPDPGNHSNSDPDPGSRANLDPDPGEK